MTRVEFTRGGRSRSTTTFAPMLGGATASRSLPATSRSHTARSSEVRPAGSRASPRSAPSGISTRRRFGSSSRSRFAGLAQAFFHVLPSPCASRRGPREHLDERIDNPKTGEPIGSGPFLVESWERGRQLTFVRNPRYWGPHTGPSRSRRLSASCIDDPLRGSATGQLDVSRRPLDLASARSSRSFRRIRALDHRSASGVRWEHFEIRIGPGGHPALESKLVRQALAYGLDRLAIAWTSSGNRPELQPAATAPFSSRPARYYEPNWRGLSSPAGARSTPAREAGCRRGADGIYSCAGERLSLRFVANTGVASREPYPRPRPVQLRRVGVEVRPTYAPGSVVGQIVPSGEWDVWIIALPLRPGRARRRCVPMSGAAELDRLLSATRNERARPGESDSGPRLRKHDR